MQRHRDCCSALPQLRLIRLVTDQRYEVRRVILIVSRVESKTPIKEKNVACRIKIAQQSLTELNIGR